MVNAAKREHEQLNAAEKKAHRELMELVKADRVVSVERFLECRENAAKLLAAQPTGCLLVNEAVSGRMLGLLRHYMPKPELQAEHPHAANDMRRGMPSVYRTWATTAL